MEPVDLFTGLQRIGLALGLVGVAIAISRWQRANLERDLFWAAVLSGAQLAAIGYVLDVIFRQTSPLWTIALLSLMVLIGGWTAGRRCRTVPYSTVIALAAIATGTVGTLGLILFLRVFDFAPNTMIPIGGMVIGNSMITATLAIERFAAEMTQQRGAVEALLALGATGRQASLTQFRASLRSAMIPVIDTTKTTGLIKLPGAMVGMILAGASPLIAVKLQLIVMYLLLGASAFTGLVAVYGTSLVLFTPAQQLRAPVLPTDET